MLVLRLFNNFLIIFKVGIIKMLRNRLILFISDMMKIIFYILLKLKFVGMCKK